MMPLPSQTVREFISDSYQIISPNTPTVPLQGNDQSKGLQYLNELIQYYSASGLLTPIPRQIYYELQINQGTITSGSPDFTPTPDLPYGRLANIENAWVELQGVSYPLIEESRHEFNASYKYSPLQGLPRFIIIYPETNLTRIQVYPAPSQVYNLYIYGKFEMPLLTLNSTLEDYPAYYIRFLRFALAQELAIYKGRIAAWTPQLQAKYDEAQDIIEGASSFNLDIQGDRDSMLNGKWRIISGI